MNGAGPFGEIMCESPSLVRFINLTCWGALGSVYAPASRDRPVSGAAKRAACYTCPLVAGGSLGSGPFISPRPLYFNTAKMCTPMLPYQWDSCAISNHRSRAVALLNQLSSPKHCLKRIAHAFTQIKRCASKRWANAQEHPLWRTRNGIEGFL